MNSRNFLLLCISIILIGGAIGYIESQKPPRPHVQDATIHIAMPNEEKERQYEKAKEIIKPAGFINTDSVSINDVIGKKIILVDFWTYSCINCQRTLPYLTAWYEKYRDKGLEIVGVHTPEFEFEKKYENVKRAVEQYGIHYPVVLDNDYATWNAYGNRYWPRKYLIDIDGYIAYDHIGEGGYEETEKTIQKLLQERMAKLSLSDTIDEATVKAIEAEVPEGESPEIYFGAGRNLYLGNGISQKKGVQALSEPTGIKTNILYLSGTWNFEDEFAENKEKNARIIFRYRAKSVYMVASADAPVSLIVLLDGKPLEGNVAGGDSIQKEGRSILTIHEDRLYKIIQDAKGVSEHTLELIIETPGVRVFTFTFG